MPPPYCHPNDKPINTITINLRGTLFVTDTAVLTSFPINKFSKYNHYGENNRTGLNEEDRSFNAPPDERCYGYFIDRDPTHFHHILNFIWYNIKPQQLPEHDKLQLIEEAKFYELWGLVSALKNYASAQAQAQANPTSAQAKHTSAQAKNASASWLPSLIKKKPSVSLGGGRKKSRRRRNNRKSTRRRRHRKY